MNGVLSEGFLKIINVLPDELLSVIWNAIRVSEPLCKYRHSEGREKISERDSKQAVHAVKEKTLKPSAGMS